MGSSALSLTLLLMSFIHSGLTQDSPTSTLTVTPNSTVFTGERVSLKCEIESYRDWRRRYDGTDDWTYDWTPDWRYVWWKGHTYIEVSQTSERYTVKGNTLTIERSETSDVGLYTCRGDRDRGSVSSQSNSVSLSVKDLPKTELTVDPKSPVFTGETVTLKCVIESDYSDWRYEWYRDRDSVKLQMSEHYTVNTDTLTIRGATESDQDQFWCRGLRDGRPSSSQESNRIDLDVNDLPRPTLTVTPDSPVFTGERVSLTCEIESDRDWRYEWWKGIPYTGVSQTSERYTVKGNTLTIERSETSDVGLYRCRGDTDRGSVSSQSNSVSLSVKARPKAVVKVTPDQRVFRGETVTLTCDIQGAGDTQWTYSWFKDGYTHNPYRTTTTAEISFIADYVSYSVKYSCRGERSDSQRSSFISDAVTLTVSALPRSTLTVTPNRPVFTGERVILKCEITPHYSGWRYEWNKDSTKVSESHTVNRNTLTIERSETSDAGWYTCKGQRDGRPNSSQSSSVYLSVKALPTPKLTVTPDSPVFTGERVSLKCVINSDHSDWRYEWYKDSTKVSERYRNTLTIERSKTSDAGLYTCKGHIDGRSVSSQSSSAVSLSVKDLPRSTPDSPVFTGERVNLRDGRPNSSQESERINLSVNASRSAQISVSIILSFLLAACPYLLATVVLLFKCCRARVISTEDQSQYVVTEE